MDILQVENVSKAYASHLALDDVSLSVPTGQVYGLLGPNGAGKTTLIRIINHITAPDSGQVLFDGHRITQADVANIGYLPEERGLYKKMKVGEQAIFSPASRVSPKPTPHASSGSGSTNSTSHPGGTRKSRSSQKAWLRRYSS